MQCVRSDHLGGQRVDQRLQRRRRRPDPARQGRGFQADAPTGEDLGLTIQGQVIVELRHDDVRQQPCSGAAAGNRVIGRRGRDDRIAGPAGELLAHVPDDLEAARYIVEGLGHLFADPPQGAAAVRAGAGGRVMHLFTRQMLGQWPARRLLFLDRFLDRRCHHWRGGGQPFGLVALQTLDRQLELFDLARQLLRGPAELGPPVARQLELQFGDLGLRRHRVARHLGNDALQRSDVVGKALGRDRHAGDWIRLAAGWRAYTAG